MHTKCGLGSFLPIKEFNACTYREFAVGSPSVHKAVPFSSEQVAGAEQAYQSDHNKIDRDDRWQQARHKKDQDAGGQRHDGNKAYGDIHDDTFSERHLKSVPKN
jgi:hypothetical protein